MINTFHKDYPEKFIATSPLLDSVLPMARPTVKSTIKQKYGRDRSAKFVKQIKKTWLLIFLAHEKWNCFTFCIDSLIWCFWVLPDIKPSFWNTCLKKTAMIVMHIHENYRNINLCSWKPLTQYYKFKKNQWDSSIYWNKNRWDNSIYLQKPLIQWYIFKKLLIQ